MKHPVLDMVCYVKESSGQNNPNQIIYCLIFNIFFIFFSWNTLYLKWSLRLLTISLSMVCMWRSPRPGEEDGLDYNFVSQQHFQK